MTNEPVSKKKAILVEVLNAVTHGIGTILSIIGLILLIIKGIDLSSTQAVVAYVIYGASLILLFLNSTLYHSLSFTKFKDFFQRLDHGAIYLLIAGTYTPYLIIGIGGRLGIFFLVLVWGLALVGILFELFFINKFPRLSTYMYLGLGWLGIGIIYPLIQNIDLTGILLLALGGMVYSLGVIFYSMKNNKWMHIIWHLFVMAGAFFMYISVLLYV
ncbi:hemolysin III family protein [Aerococcaceae bacterium DSM 111021]|nr:hemolysin III family protein [Aerococcaceae bacterium DSM 111021]